MPYPTGPEGAPRISPIGPEGAHVDMQTTLYICVLEPELDIQQKQPCHIKINYTCHRIAITSSEERQSEHIANISLRVHMK